jgi:hypothetical protein
MVFLMIVLMVVFFSSMFYYVQCLKRENKFLLKTSLVYWTTLSDVYEWWDNRSDGFKQRTNKKLFKEIKNMIDGDI